MIFTVAIDGPAAAGKGTIARAVAAEFGLAHLDTGLLYRAVGRRVLAGEPALVAAAGLGPADLEGDLRRPEIAEAASQVAAVPEVRAALAEFQRRFARQPGGAVLDGRDIGTVICPEAEVKLYVTATAQARAARRQAEEGRPLADVLADVMARDARDSGRAAAPLTQARDALLLDTTDLSISAAVGRAVDAVRARLGQG